MRPARTATAVEQTKRARPRRCSSRTRLPGRTLALHAREKNTAVYDRRAQPGSRLKLHRVYTYILSVTINALDYKFKLTQPHSLPESARRHRSGSYPLHNYAQPPAPGDQAPTRQHHTKIENNVTTGGRWDHPPFALKGAVTTFSASAKKRILPTRGEILTFPAHSHYSGGIPMVFQHSGGRDFDLPRRSHYSGVIPMVFQHSVSKA